ncbi:MAG: chemotaxis protein CheC [Thermoanaerobacterales bacterium]|nr:chemotaxis protein CheC [Bacillota bacterium]MDI6906115.1 chemotaxis protein CheC [Thermoanaerobacterales bacterium]
MESSKAFSAMQLDVLQEIGNIGAGNAATALASLLGARVNISVPKAAFLPLDEVLDYVGGMEESVACVQLRVTGDIQGAIVYLFSEASALRLVDLLLGRVPGETTELDEMGRSVLMEAGNILTGNFASAIGTLTGLELKPGVPMLACDMLGAVLSAGLAASGYAEDNILLVDTVFSEGDAEAIQSHFLLLTEINSLAVLLKALGIAI